MIVVFKLNGCVYFFKCPFRPAFKEIVVVFCGDLTVMYCNYNFTFRKF